MAEIEKLVPPCNFFIISTLSALEINCVKFQHQGSTIIQVIERLLEK